MADVSIKKISPKLGGERGTRNPKGPTSSHDLVEQMEFLYVEVERFEVLNPPIRPTCIPIVEITLGNYKSSTRDLPIGPKLDWNQVFAFDKSSADVLSVTLKDGYTDTVIGTKNYKLAADIPSRVLPDARLASTRCPMQNTQTGDHMNLLMSVWFGTQADEVYSNAWFSDSCGVSASCVINTRPQIYLAPRLCYVRVTIVSGHDIISNDGIRSPSVFVEVQVGEQKLKTGISTGSNPTWNQDLIFVASEPLEALTVTFEVMDKLDDQHNQCIGVLAKAFKDMEALKQPGSAEVKFHHIKPPCNPQPAGDTRRFASGLRMKLATDQSYHVFDECSQYCSDYRAFAKGLWPGVLGKLEVGILGATGLTPMKGSPFQRHAYAVAKYGNKWARTRTVVNNASPKWNEQYSWDVYEKCTVFTIGLYDNQQLVVNNHGNNDVPIGKVRIPLSRLNWNKIYTGSFPLLVLGKEGLKKTGEVQLAIRCASPPPTWWVFSPSYFFATSPFRWMLPKSHYKSPLGLLQNDDLRSRAVEVNCLNLYGTEPRLRKEVVRDMLKPRSKSFSMRRAVANLERLRRIFTWLYSSYAWMDANLVSTTNNAHKGAAFAVFAMLLVFHRFFLWLLVDLWLYAYIGGAFILYQVYKLIRTSVHNKMMNRSNAATPLVLVDLKLSKLDSPNINIDMLDEEFDSMPSSESDVCVLRMRYDRVRKMGAKVILLMGDLASQCERLYGLWRWCTSPLGLICLVFLGYLVLTILRSEFAFKCILLLFVVHWLTFPFNRYGLPSATKNYFRRFPSDEDLIIT